MAIKKILILGGYGNFGKRIAEGLADQTGLTILIGGRSARKAQALCDQLAPGASAVFEPAAIDFEAADFQATLAALSPGLVIHTGGPFQGQDYRVPRACIDIGCHYIDLADDRRFVCDIGALDQDAKRQGVLAVSGASSVPGLSSAVIDLHAGEFSDLQDIDFAIAPGNQAERGLATVRAILSYTGHRFKALRDGGWIDIYGWMEPRKLSFGGKIGERWLANVDIPDLELFPRRYPTARTVRFQAGLELRVLHFAMVAMAWLAKRGLVRNWAPLARPIVAVSEWFLPFGTDVGGMQIRLQGMDRAGRRKAVTWTLCAEHGVGPYIPTMCAILLARKLIAGAVAETGARPCLGMISLDEFDAHASRFGIYHRTEHTLG